jgi:hypothetical protein
MTTKNNKEQQRTTNSNSEIPSLSLASPREISSLEEKPLGEALASVPVEKQTPTPILTHKQVERAVITLFDNGEQTSQRYKIAVRLNLVDQPQKSSPEFIAPLSKDPRTFRRYASPGTREDLIDFHNEMRLLVKKQGCDRKPYFGKFHLNHRDWGAGQSKIQVEPYCYASVWYEDEGWRAVVRIYNFALELDLFTEQITPKQKQQNVKAQYLWLNPRYQRQQRPRTWAEQQGLVCKPISN